MRYSLLAICIAGALSLTACGKAKNVTDAATDAATKTGEAVVDGAADAGKKVVDGATDAGQAVVDAATGNADKYKDIAGVSMDITGAGASFPAPIYAKWADAFTKSTAGKVNYQSIGSSGGIKQITAKTVDFGASDAPMKPEDLEKNGLIQFPTVIGGVVPVVNVKGMEPGKLILDGATIAGIYLGNIKKWNDPAIAALNPDATLPDAAITTVFRSDGSGTTFNFTDYLAKTSDAWKAGPGVGKSISWPTSSTGAGGKGNEGVASTVKRIPNAIGYVEYAYAKQNGMSHAALKNKAGNVVQPSAETFAAAGDIDWSQAPGFYKVITDSDTDQAWPISAATFILVHTKPEKPEQVAGALNFFNWAYNEGDAAALELDYVPFSDKAVGLFKDQWNKVVGADGKPVYTPK